MPRTSFFTPTFTWHSKGHDRPNVVVFRNPSFAASDPQTALVLGHQADVSGIVETLALTWEQNWVEVHRDHTLFALGSLSNDAGLRMEVAVIDGPVLDETIRRFLAPQTPAN